MTLFLVGPSLGIFLCGICSPQARVALWLGAWALRQRCEARRLLREARAAQERSRKSAEEAHAVWADILEFRGVLPKGEE